MKTGRESETRDRRLIHETKHMLIQLIASYAIKILILNKLNTVPHPASTFNNEIKTSNPTQLP